MCNSLCHVPVEVLWFRDRSPLDATLFLVMLEEPVIELSEAGDSGESLLGHVMIVGEMCVAPLGLTNGFRMVVDEGPEGGQSVYRIHLPVLGGRQSDREWRLTVDYRSLNEVTPSLSPAVPDMLELQYELDSKAAKWYSTIDFASAFFSIPLATKCRPQFALTWRGVQYTWNPLPQRWKHSPTICHGLIQTALEKDLKQEIAHAIALGPVRTGPEVKNMLYSAAGNNGLSWSLWQKVPGETQRQPLQFWSQSYRGSKANNTPTEKVTVATEGEVVSAQLAELKAIQLSLDIAEREKWPKLYLYIDSWIVANALWGWLERWKKDNWQPRGRPVWAAEEWQDIASHAEKLPMKVCHVDAHVPKSQANEEHQNNKQVDQATKTEESQIHLDWQHKGEIFPNSMGP
ncbi:hypothetical protein DUI87_02444 [Hirundo rustica rustica]|uniref:ribonuclease H n=1 Tax=Hirundo rustica rustica TaxID=333673 RepID=A0A3M0LRD6_HIRRU|nr:hypothetical protein DUI87_02444 [Hirundo rustica rustica]